MNGSKARGICLLKSQVRDITVPGRQSHWINSDQGKQLTQVLHVLVRQKHHSHGSGAGPRLHTGAISFEDNDTVCRDGGHESCSIAESCPS